MSEDLPAGDRRDLRLRPADAARAAILRRREFLKALLAGAAGAPLAMWIGGCGGRGRAGAQMAPPPQPEPVAPPPQPEPVAPTPPSSVGQALAQARSLGRPLIVLVIPSDRDRRWEHGQAFGQLLQHGSEDLLAKIAGCEVVCAEMAEARADLVGIEGVPARECAALVVLGTRARALDVDLAAGKPEPTPFGSPNLERSVRERIARLEAALAPLLDVPPGASQRYRKDAPPGSAWATDTGCVTEVEGQESLSAMIACGMGSVPVVAQRFLYYLVAQESGR